MQDKVALGILSANCTKLFIRLFTVLKWSEGKISAGDND